MIIRYENETISVNYENFAHRWLWRGHGLAGYFEHVTNFERLPKAPEKCLNYKMVCVFQWNLKTMSSCIIESSLFGVKNKTENFLLFDASSLYYILLDFLTRKGNIEFKSFIINAGNTAYSEEIK